MKALATAAFLLALAAPPAFAQAEEAPPSEALVDRLLAVLPDSGELSDVGLEVNEGELSGLVELNPGKEAQVRAILQANLPCSRKAATALTERMLRTIARSLGEAKLARLVAFYEGPDYAAFTALAARMNDSAAPTAEDKAAMAKLMEAYPLQAYHDALGRSGEVIEADEHFMEEATKCASEQMAALEAAGLKSH
ncbi:MAG TPA: hypothetical protein VF759_16365 [Allosphingosinicella sp.]|jgi:hypothetical protein